MDIYLHSLAFWRRKIGIGIGIGIGIKIGTWVYGNFVLFYFLGWSRRLLG